MEDKLMKMSEYAESRGVSYEGVRRKVIRNYDKLNLCKRQNNVSYTAGYRIP